VSIEWTTDSSTAADRTSVVRLVQLPYETGDLRRTERQVMGAAIRTSEGNAVAYVFYRRVRAEADRYQVSIGSVLACAMAHELGHLLMPDAAHAASGLMRAGWGRDDFNRADQGQLRFLPDDIARIHAGLQ